MPSPDCVPLARRIWERATKPKITPRTEGMEKKRTPVMERTSDAMANPLVRAGAAMGAQWGDP